MLERRVGHAPGMGETLAAGKPEGTPRSFREVPALAFAEAAVEEARMKVTGGCHCRAVRFEAEVPAAVDVLDCNCSICARTGFRHLMVPHADFALLSGGEALTSYRFGTGAAEHLFCGTCGVKSFYQPRSHPDCWSVNIHTLDDTTGLTIHVSEFDGRNWEQSAAQL
jgi:hypothetical protein